MIHRSIHWIRPTLALISLLAAGGCKEVVFIGGGDTETGGGGSGGGNGSGGNSTSGSSGTGSPGEPCAQASECAGGRCVDAVCRCVTQLTAANDLACALKADGSVWCWGTNANGEAGDGSTEPHLTPVAVSSLGAATQVVTGRGAHTCAIRADGGVSCWGLNSHGKLGNGSLVDGTQALPGPVPGFGAGPVRQLALGGHHTCARDSGDQVWCWGNNAGGLLGNGISPDGESMPTPVESVVVAPMVQIAAGQNDNCGVAAGGTVWCWGLNDVGIGDGSTSATHPVPVQVLGLDQVVEISKGIWRTCARRSDGSVWCWGLGQPLAEEVPSLQNVAQIGVGLFHQCARKNDGTVWCWGENGLGELGNEPFEGTTVTPLQVTGLPAAAIEIAVGQHQTCARLADDSLYCWGGLPTEEEFAYSITPTPAKVPLSCP